MKVAFHTFTLNYRGTAVAIYDYAKYNQEVLGNESVIVYNSSVPYEKDVGTEDETLEFIKKSFEVRSYSTDSELDKAVSDTDNAYFIKYGLNDTHMPVSVRTSVHSVFQAKEPHGDRYAYISEWLSNTMGGDIPFVPHMVDLPEPNDSYREKLGISKDKIVLGRYGGFYTFDLPFAKKTIKEIVEEDARFVFLFVNTQPFMKHPNVRFIDSIVDRQKKSNFINTCDAMLHARNRGESFGLSVCEFLFHNKPVLAWTGGIDRNHVHLLKDYDSLYNEDELKSKILNVMDLKDKDWKGIVSQFNPNDVMTKFDKVFLQ
jgi:hypothetical protein